MNGLDKALQVGRADELRHHRRDSLAEGLVSVHKLRARRFGGLSDLASWRPGLALHGTEGARGLAQLIFVARV